jgi:hypothetical protein
MRQCSEVDVLRDDLQRVARISEAFNMAPDVAWNEADTPPGLSKIGTYWNLSSQTEGQRLFFDELIDVFDWLWTQREFVQELIDGGAEVAVTVQLPGAINIGDFLPFEVMEKALALRVQIGVEVFPGMRREPSA